MTLESCFKLKDVLHPAAISLRVPLGGARAIPRKDSSCRVRVSAKEGIWVKHAGTCQGAGTGGEHVHSRISEGNMEDMPRAQDCCCCSSLFAPLRRRASSWTLPTEGILQLEWLCHFLYSLDYHPGPLKRASPSPVQSHCLSPSFCS